mgnify:FL=1
MTSPPPAQPLAPAQQAPAQQPTSAPLWRTALFTVGCAVIGLILFALNFALLFSSLAVSDLDDPMAEVVVRNEGAFVVVVFIDLIAGALALTLLALYHRSRQIGLRRNPATPPKFAFAVAIVALSGVSSMAVIGALYAMTVTARTRNGRHIAILAAVFLVAASVSVTISTRLAPSPAGVEIEALGSGIAFVVIWLICTLIGVVRGGRDQAMAALAHEAEVARREHESMLRLREAESQVVESRVEQARQAERAQITRELHDTLAHHLSLVSIHAGALEYRDDLTPEQTREAAAAVADAARLAGTDLRVALGVLREGEVAPQPLPDLSNLPALLSQLPAGAVSLTLQPPITADNLAALSASASRHLYRIVQESLTNARKHAPGECVNLTFSGEPGSGVVLEARNRTVPPSASGASSAPGTTTGPIPGSGLGLVGIAERTRLAGGGSRVEQSGTEFVLTAWVPWNA